MPPESKAASRKAASASTAPHKTVPTSTASVQATVVCSVCCQPIVDEKDQALFCDGICQSLHSDTSLSCLIAEQQPSTLSSMNSSFHLTTPTNASSLEPASDDLNSVSEPFLGSLQCQ